MSSLTSLGVNKNKKGFAPKIKKRKDRNSNSQKLASTSTQSTAPITTHNVTSTSTILPTPIAPATTMATLPPPSLPIQKESPKYPSLDPKTPPPVNAPSPSLSNMKKEPLTEEEMAINASGPARRRRRRPSASPPPPTTTAQLSVPSTYGNTLSAPSPVTSPSPNNAPSPVAPVIERPDCAFEAHARSPALKIERVTPDARSKLFDPSPVPSSDNDIGYGDLMDSDDADDKHSLDDVDIDFDTTTTTTTASSQQQPRRQRETTAETSEDEEVNVITVAPRRSRQQAVEQPSSQTEEPVEQQSQREETVEPPVEANDDNYDDSDYQESSNSPAKKRKTTSKTKAVKKKAAAKKGKKTDKAKKTTPASTEPEAQNAEASSSSRRNKRKATAISVGIGIPVVANASSSNNNTRESSVAGESTDDDDNDRNKKKKKRGRGGLDRTDFRFVENMRTLDDVTGDPAKVEYLDQPMSNFTRDIDGVVSKTFKEMETQRQTALQKELDKKLMSPEELEELKKKEAEEEREAAKKKELAEKAKEEERRRREAERDVLTESSNAVQVRIVNGEIVLDTDTLVVERRQATEEFDGEPREVVEENSMSRKVNSQSYGKRKQSSRWDALETELFYECLSQFGTDFEMISQVLPGRTRGQVRTKFNREERLNPMKVTDYLIKKRKPLDIEKYKEMAGVELEAVPEDFHEMQLA
ncbi:MAG: hypothetical protein EXX96DRAFT_587227 [Benjaminiella poitrasii]|nr:MAG: hypothetical protein EXX96DRAFT_587227 [Benjaminiella poitrasii]